MPPIRLALLLLILAGMTLFALQNWLPVLPLVIAGTQTQALPLAVWIVGAIAAGAVTTLITAVLFKLSIAAAPRRPARRTSRRVAGDPQTPWTPPRRDEPMDVPFTVTNSVPNSAYGKPYTPIADDDWEQSSRSEAWDDWEEDRVPVQQPIQEPIQEPIDRPVANYTIPFTSSQTVIQDDPIADSISEAATREDREEWEDWEDYDEISENRFEENNRAEERGFEEDEFEDDFEDELSEVDEIPAAPPRTIFEVQQTPKTSYQSGSLYSYSYRDSSDSGGGKTDVYEADYRVIIPPYRSDVEEVMTAAGEAGEAVEVEEAEEDWGFEEDFEENEFEEDVERDDRPEARRSRPSADEDW